MRAIHACRISSATGESSNIQEAMTMADSDRTHRMIYWLRILAIAYALFLMLFSLDVFEIEASFIEQLGGFIMHSLPSIVLLVAIAATWRKPLWMGAAVMAFALVLTIMFRTYRLFPSFIMLSLLPALLGAALMYAGRTAKGKV